jgi:hypothetical protein
VLEGTTQEKNSKEGHAICAVLRLVIDTVTAPNTLYIYAAPLPSLHLSSLSPSLLFNDTSIELTTPFSSMLLPFYVLS